MLNRRQFLFHTGAISALSMLPAKWAFATTTDDFLMPDEGDKHRATWLAYGATVDAWGKTGKFGMSRKIARQDLIRIALNISRFEPVKMLVNQQDLAEAQQLLVQIQGELSNGSQHYSATDVFTHGKALPSVQAGGKIEFLVCPLNDLWIRDTGAIFVKNSAGEIGAVDFNFNGWGQVNTGAKGWKKDPAKRQNGIEDQPIDEDRGVAQFMTRYTKAKPISTWLVMEGGGIEVNGYGTAICTESCILNDNRNPNRTKAEVEAELARTLGIRKVIWLKGVKAQDITDGHIDFYARFIDKTTVAYAWEMNEESSDYDVTRENKRLLAQATDAEGNKLTLIPLQSPDFDTVEKAVSQRQWQNKKSYFNDETFAAGYIGYYAAEKFILMAQFGDEEADRHAFETLQKAHPHHTIMQIATDGLANGGGTIHCATQQQIG
ncbi:hypothetical protein A4G19_06970 [Pasteurellaceae bacterium Macca]|nr:hypothetical protein [Pasteurellaceae bacterium Macca]